MRRGGGEEVQVTYKTDTYGYAASYSSQLKQEEKGTKFFQF